MTQLTFARPALGIVVRRGCEPDEPTLAVGYVVIVALYDGSVRDKVWFERVKEEWLAAESAQAVPGLLPLHAVFALHGDLAEPGAILTDQQVARRAARLLADPIVFSPGLTSWRSVQRFAPPGEDAVYQQIMSLTREGDDFVIRIGGVEQRAGEPEVNLDDFTSWVGLSEVRLPCEPFQQAYEQVLHWLGRR